MQIVVGSTTAFLAAGRFGLAPSVKKSATAGLKLVEDPAAAGLKTGDPAGKQSPLLVECQNTTGSSHGYHARHFITSSRLNAPFYPKPTQAGTCSMHIFIGLSVEDCKTTRAKCVQDSPLWMCWVWAHSAMLLQLASSLASGYAGCTVLFSYVHVGSQVRQCED